MVFAISQVASFTLVSTLRRKMNLSVRTIILLSIIFFMGCTPKLPFLIEQDKQQVSNTVDEVNALDDRKFSEIQNDISLKIDPRLEKIIKSPSLLANKKNIEAARKNVSIIKTQAEPNLSAISNIGPKLDNDDIELDATGGFSLTKLVSDGGELNAITASAQLNVTVAKLAYIQSVNVELMKVLRAEQTILNFYKIKKIYEEQLAVYNENLPLIKTAAKANIISKTDILKLEQLKLKSEEAFLTSKTAADAANLLRKKYNLTKENKFFEVDLEKWKSFESLSKETIFSEEELIETQISILEKDIEAIDASYSPYVALAGTATADVTNIDESLGFLGVNITLPVKDGGKRDFQRQEKTLQIEALRDQKEDLTLLQKTAFESLKTFDVIYKMRSKLLIEQIDNSKIIAEDMELKLRAGAVSVIDLATEKMNFYDLRIQKIALEYQLLIEIMNFHQAVGRQCDLTNLCDQIESLTN